MRLDHIFEVTFVSYVAVTGIGTLLQMSVLILYEPELVKLNQRTRHHVEHSEKTQSIDYLKIKINTSSFL